MAATQRHSRDNIKLCQAAYDNDVEGVELEIASGAKVNTTDESGWTPLMNAAFSGAVEAVEVLLAHPEIDVDACGEDGVTALMNACLVGNVRIVNLLLNKSNVNVLARDNAGYTALDHANRDAQDDEELYERLEQIRKLLLAASTKAQLKPTRKVLEKAKIVAKRVSGHFSLTRGDKKKAESKKTETPEEEEKPKKKVQKNRMRCFECRKKVGLTGLECQCGFVFCGQHNYPANHNCDFDFKADARERYMQTHAGKGAVAEKIQDGEKL
uniref:AN1-type domain-containing protein n=1 Tax=Aplanochytrium stocchinoi TaxID=215587 RepID=A0A7S3PK35_9STRA|mmetsp:Transcript_11118/g.13896  ORF Transcript_11118/g.13896 Transcript_11118/m.13896 type:complete len:269 (+) Transcript_11118:294-1100(+)|eukprot:CAMPEP_0204841262 /NCGR_PEP_ID=MMETSP1346-20131115/41350_1 /ASSEMBLY_ACC=CAM_ASM_000771 /TAXON_ID=215587 /ORGANISM="Aplanochytrium stocchinoi, Strain GSBS06" /LENGTH=268 /DNA_ID=CAMNT_0051979287 /DNA_START=306 /DNA_END=1112 /DNA_ORIENTATION=-